MAGAGSLYRIASGEFVATIHDGDAAGLAAAKAALASGGLMQIGPGNEAIPLGSGWANICLALVTDDGVMGLSRFHILDGTDPTKRQAWDVSAITTGLTRTVVAPNYGGFLLLPVDLGTSGQFLRSNGAGVQPSWSAVTLTNVLLDGANHTDTLAGSVLAGDLIFGNSTPKWARLAAGTNGQVLTIVSGAPTWSAQPTAVEHSALSRLIPFSAADCTWTTATAAISTTGGAFANVKVGDFIFLGTNTHNSTQGSRVLTVTDTNNITADRTNTGATLSGVTILFFPGDHWNDTLAIDTGLGGGLFITGGRGTYSTDNTSGTFQEIRGPVRWLPQNSGNLSSDFRAMGSASTTTLSGFAIQEAGLGSLAYFFAGLLTANRVYSFPDVSGPLVVTGGAQTLTDKTLGTGNKIAVDGTATRTVFQTGGGADRLAFDVGTMSALRAVTWPDYAGRASVEGSVVTFADADTTPSVSGSRVFKASNTGATSITTFDDGINGEEIVVIFTNGNTTIVAGANMKLSGGINFVGTTDDTLSLVYDGTTWWEKARSLNA